MNYRGRDYRKIYQDPAVRARILEFLGGDSIDAATCLYLSRTDLPLREPLPFWPIERLDSLLDEGIDLGRSLWDRDALIVHLDIEYVNFDFLLEPYLDAERSFTIQEPVAHGVERVLVENGIVPLHLLTGRGHHFLWRIGRDSDAFRKLARLGRVPRTLEGMYQVPQPVTGQPVPPDLGAAFAGLGLVMEFLVHRVKREVSPVCEIPLELTAVSVGPGKRGREIVSLDISEYGDPLPTRLIRIPYTLYNKPDFHPLVQGAMPWGKEACPLFTIPFHEMSLAQALKVMRDPDRLKELATRASAGIPDQSEAMERILEQYQRSPLKTFHDFFYSQEHQPPDAWPFTYDRTPLEALLPCARHVLFHPNELLLKPAGIELVTRTFLALGWHPRHIAGLIRSKYERDFGWGSTWYVYDASTRADFYVRVFSGLFATGVDDLMDFNCNSTKEKQFCFMHEENCAMDQFKNSLLERRKHERLACRPFNGLFLPDQHS